MQNKDTKPISHPCQKLLNKGRTKRDFGVMGFPPQSPDLNPSEHFWEHLKREKVKHKPTSLNNQRDVIHDCWKNIKDSMPGRIKTVLKEKSRHTKY